MQATEQHELILRYRDAGNRLLAHIRITDIQSQRFGFAYLSEHLADDIAEELRLRDAFDDARAALAEELRKSDIIDCGRGYYKIDALGVPQWYANEEAA